MSGLKNTFRRIDNAARGKGWATNREKREKAEAKEQARKDSIYAGAQIPDEEEVRRNERRKAAKRRGSRVSTVLTEKETLG